MSFDSGKDGRDMKKKILALILCCTLCVIGLPFSVNAVELVGSDIIIDSIRAVPSDYCDCDTNYDILYDTPRENCTIAEIYGLKDKCCKTIVPYVHACCPLCLEEYDLYNVPATEITHRYKNNGQCKDCGYWRASK